MSLIRALAILLCPPAAVIDKGCGPILLVFVLSLLGWIPGVILASIFVLRDDPRRNAEGDKQIAIALLIFVGTVTIIVWAFFSFLRDTALAVAARTPTLPTLSAPASSPTPQATPSPTPSLSPGDTTKTTREITIPIEHGLMRLPAGSTVTVESVHGQRITVRAQGQSVELQSTDLVLPAQPAP